MPSPPRCTTTPPSRTPTEPHAYRGDARALDDLDPDLLAEAVERVRPGTAPMTIVFAHHLGGALASQPDAPNCVGHRAARFMVRTLSPSEGADPEQLDAVHREVLGGVDEGGRRRMLNFLFGANTSVAGTADCYEPADLDRLARLKRDLDPDDVFRGDRAVAPLRD